MTDGRRLDDDAHVLAIDFGGTKIAVGASRLDGALMASERIPTQASGGAAQAVERALEVARRLRDDAEGSCVGAAAVSPGIVGEDRVLLAPNVLGWDQLRLPSLLRDGLGLSTVTVANDVNAAALAELRWGALRGAGVGVFVSLGTGIKAALVIGGHVFEGAHGAAGEIGYSLRDPADGAGIATGHAPLEESVGGRGLGARASELLGVPLAAADVFTRPDAAPGLLDDWLAELTMHLANLTIAVDPECVVLGGGLMAREDVILPALRERFAQAVPFPPLLLAARFRDDGALRGAAALAIDRALTASEERVA
jgi:glucokinase